MTMYGNMFGIVHLIMMQEIGMTEVAIRAAIKLGEIKFNGKVVQKEGPVMVQAGRENIFSIGKRTYKIKALRTHSYDDLNNIVEGKTK